MLGSRHDEGATMAGHPVKIPVQNESSIPPAELDREVQRLESRRHP
jgi:hypothetical protein